MKKGLLLLIPLLVLLAFGACSKDDKEEAPKLETDVTELIFDWDGISDNNKLVVKANVEWEITIPEDADWLTLSGTAGSTNRSITVTTTYNGTLPTREATIVVSPVEANLPSIQVKIIQEKIADDLNVLTVIKDAALADYCKQFDVSGDGELSLTEAAAVKTMAPKGLGIKNLKGLELFTQLISLDCSENDLTEIALTENLTLQALNCSDNRIVRLNVSKNTALTYLMCNNNLIANLDISANTDLEQLYANENQLVTIDLTTNKELTELSCANNQIQSLDLSTNTLLTGLNSVGNSLLKTIYVWEGFDVDNPSATLTSLCNYDSFTTFEVKK